MSLATLGLNHKTAPVEIREKITFSPETMDTALFSLLAHPLITGGVIISTCNRTEIYLSYNDESNADIHSNDIKSIIKNWVKHHCNESHDIRDECFYWLENENAVQHLMRVACGIDSLILGEAQILGQVRQAYHYSKQNSALSTELNRLFQKVFFVAKRVRTETSIGSSSASVAYSTCMIVRNLFPNRQDLNLMLIGAGEMNELISRYLTQHSFHHIIIANRSYDKAKPIADRLQAEVITLSDISARLRDVDVVISSTASPLPLIGKGMMERTLTYRQSQKKASDLLLIDLAVPRDIEHEIKELHGVHLYTIDDLKDIVSNNMEARAKSVKNAEQIIMHESILFMQWIQSQSAIRYIKKYRSAAKNKVNALLDKAKIKLANNKSADEVMTILAHQITNALLHQPTIVIKKLAIKEDKSSLNQLVSEIDIPGQRQKKN